MDARGGVRGLEVVDQLRDVLDGVDVVVRWRRDEADARGRVPGAGDPWGDLVGGELATLARLRPLGDLDLEVVGVDEVLARHAETPGGHLLDCAPSRVAVRVTDVAGRVLAPFARVRPRPETVHRDGERLVSLRRDGPVGHRARREAFHDLRDRLHLVDRYRFAGSGPELEEAAQRREARRLVVDRRRVLLEDPVPLGTGGVLELEDGPRVEEVVLP